MSGGLTLSGGEPLMQHRFAVKFLAAARAMGIHTALDTNGYFGDRLGCRARHDRASCCSGIKTLDPERHKRLTGMEVGPTLEFARRLAERKRPIWLRFVLVPGLTDDPADVKQIARFVAGLGNVRACGRAAVPSDGTLQMAAARPELHARFRSAAQRRSRRADDRDLSSRGTDRVLISDGSEVLTQATSTPYLRRDDNAIAAGVLAGVEPRVGDAQRSAGVTTSRSAG